MKFIYSFILIYIFCIPMNAQDGLVGNGNLGSAQSGSLNIPIAPNHLVSQQFFDDAFAGKYSSENKYFDIEGSAFLTDEPTKSILVMNDGKQIKDVPLQIDLFRKEIIATTAKGDEIILDKRHFQEIIIPIEGRDVSFRKINLEEPDEFYEVLYIDVNLVFFKEMYVTRKEAMSNGRNTRPAEFTQRVKYYIKHGDNKIKKIKLKKKKIFKLFSEDEVKLMKDYATDNDIKFKNEYDYVAVFEGVFK